MQCELSFSLGSLEVSLTVAMTNDLDRLTESVCFLAQPVAALPSVQLPGLQTVS